MNDLRLQNALSIPAEFRFDEVSSLAEPKAAPTPAPGLGPLAAFAGTFRGKGFNTIFRPDLGSPTRLPVPATDDKPAGTQPDRGGPVVLPEPRRGAQPRRGACRHQMAFLMGDAHTNAPNAQAATMESTFWIETVEYTVRVPVHAPGQPLTIAAEGGSGGAPVPDFRIDPPVAITAPRTIKATAPQIQYAQKVFLNFNGLTWPHVSVATLVPTAPVAVPASAFA